MRRGAIGLMLAAAAIVLSCNYFLPERFAVNAPVLSMLTGQSAGAPVEALRDSRLQLPPGFEASIFAEDLSNVRWLMATAGGDLIVTQPRSGSVVWIEGDHDRDGRSDGRRSLLSDLNRPHGIQMRDGWLYIGETDAIGRIRFDALKGVTSGDYETIVTGLPGGGNHWSRNLGFGPDGWLYVNIGSSCNACIEKDERRATIMRFRPDGSQAEIFAAGLRNSVGFDWQPSTGVLYATDNGRDLLGDDFPPCELNRVERGQFYGWPFVNGDRVPDPDYGTQKDARIATAVSPAHAFRAHNAPLGIHFIRGSRVPTEYRGAALVALHGSWNRTVKDGYKVVSLHFSSDGSIEERDFFTGFNVDDDVIGRPVHVVEGPEGEFYLSDDFAGVIWRIAYRGTGARATTRATAMRAPTNPRAQLAVYLLDVDAQP